MGIFEENLSKIYWGDFEETTRNFEEIFKTFGRTYEKRENLIRYYPFMGN